MEPVLLGAVVIISALSTPVSVFLLVRAHRFQSELLLTHLRETRSVGGDTQEIANRRLDLEDRKLSLEEKRLDLEGQIRTARSVQKNRELTAAQILGG